ncbi:MAG: methionine ABC transporter permease [Candidatus Izemoplasmataceae bacterium]
MTFVATVFVAIAGLVLGVLLFVSAEDGLKPNKSLYASLSVVTSVGRSIPFLILIVLLIPITRILIGSILGPSAALPALVVGGTPFYARLVELALFEKGHDLKETGKAFGLTDFKIMTKVLIPESLPALVRGITVTAIALAGYTSIAGAIGAGGLGNLAYLYGYSRNQPEVTWMATILMVGLIIAIQLSGDLVVKKLSHNK